MKREDQFQPNTRHQIDRLRLAALVLGLFAAAAAAAGFFIAGPERFFQSYLFAYTFWLEFSLGCLALAMLHYLVGGEWGMMVRRIAEAGAKTLWLLALLFIPIIFGLQYLYPWAMPEVVAANPLLEHKVAYLNPTFFVIRAGIYFAIWLFFAWRLTSWGRNPATFTEPLVRRRFQRVAAFGLILYILSMSFAAVDWIMSLQPLWYSSIFGLVIIVGQALTGFAFSIALLPWLVSRSALAEVITPRHYRDLGAFLFSFVIIWAYIAYSQLIVIYSANLPVEVSWYLARVQGGWLWVAITIFLVQFGLPFIALLSLRAKRNPRVIAGLSVLILGMRLLENFWEVVPAFYPALTVHWLDLALPAALGGLWLAAFFWHLVRTPLLIPIEPRREHSHVSELPVDGRARSYEYE